MRAVSLPNTDFTLRYDFNALCALEEKTGENILENFQEWQSGKSPSMRQIRVYIWGGLLHNNPKVTLEDAGNAITEAGLQASMDAMTKALNAAFPSGDGDSEKK